MDDMDEKAVKTLRASRSNLQADVVIGSNKYGSDVTVAVQLNRNEPAVAEALAPLTALLVERAKEQVNVAAMEGRVLEEVRVRVNATLASERKATQRIASERIKVAKDRLESLGKHGSDIRQSDIARIAAELERDMAASA